MAIQFPLYIDLHGNNCTIFGGDESALRRASELRRFGAKVTIVSPTVCDGLAALSDRGEVRHIPRKYFRGDCSNSQLCVAATEEAAVNIAIATECKAKGIPVEVTKPKEYGNFTIPRMIIQDGVVISVAGETDSETLQKLRDKLRESIPQMLNEIEKGAE